MDRRDSGRSLRLTHLTFALILVLVCGMASAARLRGHVKQGVYTSPAKNFSVPVPKGLGMRVSDDYTREPTTEFGAVSFHDDFGTVTTIHYMGVAPEAEARLDEIDTSSDMLGKFLPNAAMPMWFANASPQSRIVRQSNATFENMAVSLAHVEIPGGSTMAVLDASGKSKRMDSLRGVITFHRGRFIYLLSTELKGLAPILEPAGAAPSDENWMEFADRLQSFYRSIAFAP